MLSRFAQWANLQSAPRCSSCSSESRPATGARAERLVAVQQDVGDPAEPQFLALAFDEPTQLVGPGLNPAQPVKHCQCASGSGRTWNLTTLGKVPFPVSRWNGVRLPSVVHSARPFQPALGSSMRPSMYLAKKPSGYGTRMLTHLPSTSAMIDSFALPVAIGVLAPRPEVLNWSTQV